MEETSITFTGFPGGYSEIFQTYVWEFVKRTEPFITSGLRGGFVEEFATDLKLLVENSLKFEAVGSRSFRAYGKTPFDRGNYSVIPTTTGFSVYPTSPPKRLKELCSWSELRRKESSFLYEGIPRKAQVKKLLPWGFRGVTEEGYRNFRWDKMALMPRETPRDAMTLKVKSNSLNDDGMIYIWVAEAYENSVVYHETGYLRELILFEGKRIVSPGVILRRQTA